MNIKPYRKLVLQNLNKTILHWRYRFLYLWKFIETLTPQKLVNYVRNRWEFKNLRPVLNSFPPQVIIDITNICNLKCPLCPTGARLLDREKGKMDIRLYEDLLDQLKAKVLVIHLYNWGEPLMLRKFEQYCHLAKQRGFVVSTSSNLNIQLSRQKVADIINSGLDRLIVSFDGLSEKTYQLYRKGGDFGLLCQNLRLLVEMKKDLGKKYPLITLQFVRHKTNHDDLKHLGRACLKLGADFWQTVDILLLFGLGDNERLIKQWITEDRLDNSKERFDIRKTEQGLPCVHLWKYPIINFDGTISPCCYVYLQSDDIGDLKQNTFYNIWNSKRYVKARKMFSEKNDYGLKPCSDCTVFKAFSK